MKNHRHPQIGYEAYADVWGIMASGKLSGFRATPSYHAGGEWVQKLESEFGDFFGVKHAIALQSATAGLHAALIACGIELGNEVIVTPYSFSASASCPLMVGAKPVFCDIEDKTFNMNPAQIVVSPNTRAIIPVHLHGHPAQMDEIMELAHRYNLKIIEDAAQSIGAKYKGKFVGTIGDCGVFSFNQSKHISTGEGGMLITNDDAIAESVRATRNHGEVSCNSTQVGYNYRMNEIEACIASEQFKRLDHNIKHRQELAVYMTEKLTQIKGLTPPYVSPDATHVYYTYAVKVDKAVIGMTKQEFCKRLGEKGVYFGDYVKPLHLLPIFGGREGQMPVAERIWRDELIVMDWIREPYTRKDVDEAIRAMKEVINGNKKSNS